MSRADYNNLIKKQFDERNIAYSDGKIVSAGSEFARSGNKAYDSIVTQTLQDRKKKIASQQASGRNPGGDPAISDWMDRYNRVMHGISDYDKKRNGGYTQDASGGFGTEIEALIADYDGIKGIAGQYGFRDSQKYLNQLKKLQESIGQINESFSQFEDEDAYTRYLDYWKDQEEKKNLDLDAYSRELEALEQQDIDWTDANQRKQHEAEINRRKQYLTQAQRIQEKDSFASVANPESEKYDAAFDSKSGYVSTHQDGKLQQMLSQYSMGYDDLTYEYINNQNGIREEIKQKAGAYGNGETPFEKKGYDYMTEDEVGLYNYYYSMGGKASAEAYLETIQDDLNQRKAAGMYQPIAGKTGAELVFGVEAGLDQFKGGIQGAVRAVKGDDSYVAPSAHQYASQMVREDLADDGAKLPSWLGGASLGQVGYDTITTTANMAPSIAVGMLNPAVGSAALGVSAGGNAYQEALNEGYSVDQARGYGILSGASEVVMERLLGGISAYGGNNLGKFFTQNMRNADSALRRIAREIGGSMLSEFREEYLQEVLTPVFQNLTLGTDNEVKLVSAEALYAGFLGAITGGLLEGPQAIMKGRNATAAPNNATAAPNNATELAKNATDTIDNTTEPFDNTTPVLGNTDAALEKSTPGGVTEKSSAVDDKMSATEAVAKNATTTVGVSKMETVQQTADIESFAQQFGTQANAVRRNYMDGQDLQEYELGFQAAYAMGLEGGKEESLEKNVPYLTQSQRDIAFGLGRDAAALQKVAVAEKKPFTNAKLSADGNAVNVSEVVSMDENTMTFRLEDGRTVTDEELDFENGQQLLSTMWDLGLDVDSVNTILQESTGTSATDAQLAAGVEEAYRYGSHGYGMDQLTQHGADSAILTEKQMKAAYNAGLRVHQQAATSTPAARNTSGTSDTGVYLDAGSGSVTALSQKDLKGLTGKRKAGVQAAVALQKLGIGANFYFYESYVNDDGDRVYRDEDGIERTAPNGWYDPKDDSIHIDLNAGSDGSGLTLFTLSHELTHFVEQRSKQKYQALADFLVENYGRTGESVDAMVMAKKAELSEIRGEEVSYEEAYSEFIADSMEAMLADGNVLEKLTKLKNKDQSLFDTIRKFFEDLGKKIREIYSSMQPDSDEGRAVLQMKDQIEQIQQLFAEALVDASENYDASVQIGLEVDADTESIAPAIQHSERTWKESDYVQQRNKAAQEIAEAIGVSVKKAKAYIDSVNSIAKMIAEDRTRLDYFSSPHRSSFVSNVEYGGSFDFSTLCKKRRLLTGTFTAIQKALPNTALTADEILDIRNRMKDAGLEVSCGLCYVEGSRANMGQFAKEFLRLYKQYYPDAWQPNMADVNTPDGIEWVRINHPECYEQYEYFWNHYGTLKAGDKNLFASQQKPKLYQLHTEYKGEILQKFKGDDNVEEKNLNGGIRLQSFSDFEIVHLIDTMQIIMDMSRVGLAGQAYTKVPDFAWALGDTGLKINLSLIAKGVDESGNLIFDDIEGMSIAEAMRLRDRYSDNVGTILVAFNDAQLMAAMADDRVDFIIPFHRSQWKKSQYEAMGLPAKTKDYTFMQNEKFIKPQYHEYRGRMVKDKATNYMPNEYWDFSKSGKENAIAYLEMCARNNKRPKFYKLLQNNGDGSYSLKADGSTDGYWKLLIDFKMYDNDGNGSPQMPVRPDFNMAEATRMLESYQGGHSNFPVAQGIVDSFVSEYKENHGERMYSDRKKTVDNSSVQEDNVVRGENYEDRRIRKGTETGTAGSGNDRRADPGSTGHAPKTPEWRSLDSGVKRKVRSVIKKHLNSSPNINEALAVIYSYVGRTDETITEYTDRKAMDILAEKLYTAALTDHPVIFESNWSFLGGSISSLQKNIKSATQNTPGGERMFSDRRFQEVTENALHTFGTTTDFREAGFILPNGKMLRFTDNRHPGERIYDHRAIGKAYGVDVDLNTNHGFNYESNDFMDEFVENGGIRFDPGDLEFNMDSGMQLSRSVPLTREQEQTIRDFIEWKRQREENYSTEDDPLSMYSGPLTLHIDFGGNANVSVSSGARDLDAWGIKHLTYEGGQINASRIISDIRHYYRTGEIRKPSMIAQFRYQDRASGTSNRALLAGAFEGLVTSPEELEFIRKYQENIELLNEQETKLQELRGQIREISFGKGPRDAKRLAQLQEEATKTANRIDIYDKKLLKLERAKPLRDVLDREREKVRKATRQKGQEAMAEYREKRRDSAARKDAKRKIRKAVMDLDKLLNRGDKKKNVKDGMSAMVSSSLKLADALFMDEYTNRDMLRNGVGFPLTDAEEKLFQEAKQMMIHIESGAAIEGMEFASEIDAMEQMKKLDARLSGKMSGLKDVFARERKRLYGTTVSDLIGKLAEEYSRLSEADDGAIRAAKDENVYAHLLQLQKDVGGTTVRDMTLSQLEQVADAYTMVLTTVRNANKMFAQNLKFKRDTLAGMVMGEIGSAAKKLSKLIRPGKELADSFSWNNLKPVYAFERLGSETLKTLFGNIRKGQDVWSQDMQEADLFRREQYRKHNRKSWDLEEMHSFEFESGKVELSLEQIMSLYAYSRREAALDHLLKGGFVFGGSTEVFVKENGIRRRYLKKDATAYNLTADELMQVIHTLSEEQKAFVVDMQTYLSDVMGGKGNEVSMQMYGIKSFGEKNYFPLRSAGQYMEKAKEDSFKKEQGQISIVNSGFTKATTPHASNPITLDGFMDVWAEHVNDMSMYHGFVLPMEDFRRVYNYSSPNVEEGNSQSVNAAIENAFGKAATSYIDQLYKDLNGGAVSDNRETVAKKLVGLHKKAAVFASASVVIQQPSAIVRAFALMDPGHFVGPKVDKKRHKHLWEELKQYAPVAFVKEMGYFDTGMGRSAKDYLQAEEYSGIREKMVALFKDADYRDEVLGKAPALADEITWCAIWEAVKRETKQKNPGMDVKGAEFLQMAGERFAEVIDKTQVYDSILSRSANMRSKSGLMNMITSFMAEPTTSINMLEDALRKGDKRQIRRTVGAVYGSVLLNSVLVSLVYAARDDDEDETWWEKYLASVAVETLDGLNPATYYPLLKDVWSIAQGFDVERADMTLITDLIKAAKNVVTGIQAVMDADESNQQAAIGQLMNSLWGMGDGIASLAGLPLKNIRRDINGAVNLYRTIGADLTNRDTSLLSLQDAVLADVMNSIPIGGMLYEKSKRDRLYSAITSGDEAYLQRLKNGYETESSYHSAIRLALRDNDSRICEAAVAWNDGDLEHYKELALEILNEGYFIQDDVVLAIRAEASAMEENEGESGTTVKGLFTNEKFGVAMAQGNTSMADYIRQDLIDTKMANGKTQEEAEDSVRSTAKSQLKELYAAGSITGMNAEKMLVRYCGYDQTGAADEVSKWMYENEHPELDGSITYSQYKRWETDGKNRGLPLETFTDVVTFRGGDTSTGVRSQEEVASYINRLPISTAQKDALWLCFWSESTLYKNAPWH